MGVSAPEEGDIVEELEDYMKDNERGKASDMDLEMSKDEHYSVEMDFDKCISIEPDDSLINSENNYEKEITDSDIDDTKVKENQSATEDIFQTQKKKDDCDIINQKLEERKGKDSIDVEKTNEDSTKIDLKCTYESSIKDINKDFTKCQNVESEEDRIEREIREEREKRKVKRMKENQIQEKDDIGIKDSKSERERKKHERWEKQKQRLEEIKEETDKFWHRRDTVKKEKNKDISVENLNEKCNDLKVEDKFTNIHVDNENTEIKKDKMTNISELDTEKASGERYDEKECLKKDTPILLLDNVKACENSLRKKGSAPLQINMIEHGAEFKNKSGSNDTNLNIEIKQESLKNKTDANIIDKNKMKHDMKVESEKEKKKRKKSKEEKEEEKRVREQEKQLRISTLIRAAEEAEKERKI